MTRRRLAVGAAASPRGCAESATASVCVCACVCVCVRVCWCARNQTARQLDRDSRGLERLRPAAGNAISESEHFYSFLAVEVLGYSCEAGDSGRQPGRSRACSLEPRLTVGPICTPIMGEEAPPPGVLA